MQSSGRHSGMGLLLISTCTCLISQDPSRQLSVFQVLHVGVHFEQRGVVDMHVADMCLILPPRSFHPQSSFDILDLPGIDDPGDGHLSVTRASTLTRVSMCFNCTVGPRAHQVESST